jgi:YbbR domain-containing protein
MASQRLANLRTRLGPGLLARILFSLVLAVLLWGWVTTQDDPEIDRAFQNITPTINNKADDLVIVDEARLSTVTVTVRGPRSEVNQLTALDIQATLNLGEVHDPSDAEIEVSATVTPRRGVRVVNITPSKVAVSIDRLVNKSFPLEVDKGASVPPYSIGNVDYNPKQVTVRGPQALIDKVARVVLPINLSDRRDNFEAQFTPEPRDNTGTRVNGLTVEPGSVTATVTVERVGRTVNIVPNIQGTPAAGFRVGNTQVSPPSVTVNGPADVLAQLVVISTAPIDVTGKSEAFSVYDVALTLPPGLQVIDRNTVNVEVQIDAEQQRQQVGVFRVAPVNIEPGLRIVGSIAPTEITVTVSGPLASIRQLSANDVQVQLDLRGYTAPGTYTLTPNVIVPSDLRVDTPQSIRVQLERIPATPATPLPAAPVPTPTPTPPAPTPPSPTETPSGLTRRENG